MDLDTLLRGTRPKVEGSINLDALFQDNSLEFFIFFSSIVAVVGRPGQTYYSAANMFMASLAEQRRLKGLAASVIHIGPIYGVGYVAQQEEVIVNKEKLRSLALVPVSEREFYQLFSEAVISGRPGPAIRGPIELINGVRRIDWHDNDKPVWATEPMMDHFIRNPDGLATFASDAEFKVPLKTQLTEAGDRDRVYNIILEGLFPKICNIFQIDSSKVDKEALARMRLDEIGIDSLLAVEIRGWFMKTLEVNVPVLKILSGGPIRELVIFAAEKIPEKFVPNLCSDQKEHSEVSDPPTSDTEDQGQDSQTDSSLGAAGSSDISSQASSPASLADLDEGANLNLDTAQKLPATQRTLRLSFSQELLWFVWSFLTAKTSLNHTAWARITGKISKPDFQRAFRLLCQQHEVLRTRFIVEDGQPMQAIMNSSMLDMELGVVNDENGVHEAVKMLKDDHIFEIERGMTVRVMLLSRSPVENFIVAGLHPLVADGFSFQNLVRGVQELYLAADNSRMARRRQFSEHSEQQHIDLAAGRFDEDIRFWKDELAAIPPSLPILSLSDATQRPVMAAYENEDAIVRVNVAIKQRIQEVCRRYRATPFHFYLAVFRALLLRYAPADTADDIIVGIGDANRTEDELLDIIGPLVNFLPIRLRASESITFTQLLQETRDKTYGALEHSKVPLQVLLNRLVCLKDDWFLLVVSPPFPFLSYALILFILSFFFFPPRYHHG